MYGGKKTPELVKVGVSFGWSLFWGETGGYLEKKAVTMALKLSYSMEGLECMVTSRDRVSH